MSSRGTKPLWTCPRCRHRFVTRNLWHSCVRVSLKTHFERADPLVRRLFQGWRARVRDCGPMTVYAQKSRIVFMVRVRFGGAVVHRTWLEGTLWVKRRLDHPAVYRTEHFGSLGYVLHLRFERPEQISTSLRPLIREAYRIGTGAS